MRWGVLGWEPRHLGSLRRGDRAEGSEPGDPLVHPEVKLGRGQEEACRG